MTNILFKNFSFIKKKLYLNKTEEWLPAFGIPDLLISSFAFHPAT